MSDILIATHREQTTLSPNTDRGVKWIKDHMILTYGTTIIIKSEGVEDIISLLNAHEITYEER